MKVAVQEFLRKGGTLEQLEERFHILIKRHKTYNNLVLLKYHSIESPMNEEIVQDCRGIILDENDNWRIVCFPYRKFFNYGEPFAATLDLNSMRVYEKLDGSLMSLYWYDNKWHVSSSGTPDANGNVNNSNETFADLFWRVWRQLGYKLPEHNGFCYFFELMTNENRIVVYHDKPRIVFHGLRCVDDNLFAMYLCEGDPTIQLNLPSLGWEAVKLYDFHTLDEIIEFAKMIDPVKMEGFVVVDKNWNRLKIKAPDYIKLHHCKDNLNSFKNLVGLVLSSESSEFLAYFPELKKDYDLIVETFEFLVCDIYRKYATVKEIALQKDFALAIQSYPYKAALFSMRKGVHKTAMEWIRSLPLDKVTEMVKTTQCQFM